MRLVHYKNVGALAAAIALAAIPATVAAHHSVPAYFDVSKSVTMVGTISKFKFENPHSILSLYVKNAAGQIEEWRAEASLAAWLVRNGWRPDMFKPGTKVIVTGAPARDPSANMIRLSTVTLPDGRKLNANNGQAVN